MTHLPGRELWAFLSTFSNSVGSHAHPDILLVLLRTSSEWVLARCQALCQAPYLGETGVDAGSGATLPELEPLLCYFLAV